MSLLNYWPTADEINDCIKHEAEGAHDAVLLAVHKPSPLSYKQISSGDKFEASEDELFKYLITKDVPSGAHVVPITGASGVGKSHMVRILTARLQSMNEDGRYVIIRIPKSASLRRVVELILEKLPGEEYAQVKAEFTKALTEELNIETAVIRFQRELDISLGALTKELEARVRANPRDSALKEQWGHAANLPKFMGDPILVDYFREKVFPRFVQRAIAGQSQAAQEAYVKDFDADDFQLPDTIDITKAASPTHAYYTRTLLARNGEGRRAATRLLNESKVVDQAIRQLFNLHQSLGGMTLQEVILEIRRLLLQQRRELVIFVEDFKALTGIQNILLNVLIQEGVRDGVTELATMRSVIAVTDGYLDSEDTIATRAKREWKVESELSSEAEVLRRTKALIASYLNAARWGYRELVRHFEMSGGARAGQGTWIGPYADHDDTSDAPVLAAFGKEDEIPLFPYTEQAIEQLARSVLTRNNVLVFTPRFIIDDILRGLLLPGRPAFERGQFPPPDIKAPGTNAEVTQWLTSLPVSDEARERYRRVVAIWGNAPRTLEEIGHIPTEIFDGFKLDRPNIEFRSPVEHKPKVDPIQPPPDLQPKPDDEYLTEALEKWVQNGERLSQSVANQIRKSIESALNERIDWSAERCIKSPISLKQISIPNAGGEGGIATNAIVVAEDHTDPTGQLRAELAAMVRFYQLNGGKMQYAGSDDDLVWIGNLTDRLMPQALALVRASVRQKLGIAVRLLSINSRILGLSERYRTPASLSAFLFGIQNISPRPVDGAPAEFGDWRALQDRALRIRPELLKLVASYCGSFQGTGRTCYAIDMARIADCWLPETEATNLNALDMISAELKQALAMMSEARVTLLVRKVVQGACNIRTKITAELGDNFDKQEIAEELRALADQLKESGVWNEGEVGMGHIAFKNLCEEFRSGALREALSLLANSGDEEEGRSDGQLVSQMGRFDVRPLIVASRFVEAARNVVRASEKRAKGLEDQFQGVDPQAQASEIQTLFENLQNEMDTLGAGGETACS
ncbi:protein DpdH [Burkholderia gladioli]|uniref:protein DpdH n=1 Tax=Burkholderia gladioli TaxID=28095 RepID=UPI00163FA302|nr:protein DpdH [Burkholderia gladioli]MBU9187919.1 ATP-binding protein [Burkholderia gladioli]MBU9682867.1 ATP-binding protein [Burkholderia gladioli]MCA8167725.1 ATP-binding protein [Burkholderia gladioli]MDN7494111.1 protein DpdH [Burkholderia gladioli]